MRTDQLVPEPEDDPHIWNQDEADWLIGKYALVGITQLAADGKTVKSKDQYHGTIQSADQDGGFELACEGKWAGRKMMLPPDLAAFFRAEPGEYRVKASSDVVIDPDVLASWSIVEPASA
jgi:hypothetical protein